MGCQRIKIRMFRMFSPLPGIPGWNQNVQPSRYGAADFADDRREPTPRDPKISRRRPVMLGFIYGLAPVAGGLPHRYRGDQSPVDAPQGVSASLGQVSSLLPLCRGCTFFAEFDHNVILSI